MVDKIADTASYIYKSPLIKQKKLFFGTEQGNIMIIDLINNSIEKNLKIVNSASSCSLSLFNENIISGHKDGEIFLLIPETEEK